MVSVIKTIIEWIDRGYDDAARSHYAMGLIISAGLFLSLTVDNFAAKSLLLAFSVFTFLLFGRRMLSYFRRMAVASDRRKRRKR